MLRRRDRAGVDERLRRGHRSEARVRVAITASPQAIWDVLVRPGSVADHQPDVISAFVAPGTGPGVGEVQIVVSGVPGTARVALSSIVIEEFRPPHFVRFLGLVEDGTSISISEIGLTRRDSDTLVEYRVVNRSVPRAGVRTAKVPSERTVHDFMTRELSAVAHVLGAEMSADGKAVEYPGSG